MSCGTIVEGGKKKLKHSYIKFELGKNEHKKTVCVDVMCCVISHLFLASHESEMI